MCAKIPVIYVHTHRDYLITTSLLFVSASARCSHTSRLNPPPHPQLWLHNSHWTLTLTSWLKVSDVVWQDRSETKNRSWFSFGLAHCGLGLGLVHYGLGLAGLVLCCETRSCHARHRNDLEVQSNFSNTIYNFSIYSVLGTSLQWRSIAAFTYLEVKSTKCLCLLPVILVLLF